MDQDLRSAKQKIILDKWSWQQAVKISALVALIIVVEKTTNTTIAITIIVMIVEENPVEATNVPSHILQKENTNCVAVTDENGLNLTNTARKRKKKNFLAPN